jgi:hypothetical protein
MRRLYRNGERSAIGFQLSAFSRQLSAADRRIAGAWASEEEEAAARIVGFTGAAQPAGKNAPATKMPVLPSFEYYDTR